MISALPVALVCAACSSEPAPPPVNVESTTPVAMAAAPTVEPAPPEESASGPHREQIKFGAMGTDVTITAIHDDAEVCRRALAAARAEFDRVEDLMTSWRDSPLTRMNAEADGTPREVPEELAELVQRSLVVARLSGGAFDPTFASVGRLWDFKADPPVLPDEAQIQLALGSVGWEKVAVDVAASTVEMPEGTRIGLGGIAKGYGVDRAMAVLLEHGIENGVVNAGGDLKALGRDGDQAWTIGIKHPRDRERAIAAVPVSNVCLVTSGDYERFFELDGVRYHHILDPRTGRPATGCMSATVSAPDAAVADAVATAICVLGPELGLELVGRLPRIEAIVVGMDGEVQTSEGLRSATKPR